MINLNDEQFEVKNVKVFNGGVAGTVNGCTLRIERKGPEDNQNSPDYKIVVTDETGADVNKGYYSKFTNADGTPWSNKRVNFFVKEMKHLASVFDVELPNEIASLDQLLDLTLKGVNVNAKDKKINVAVSYGTEDRPRNFLEIGSLFATTKEDGVPYIGKNPLMVRPQADNFDNDPFTSDTPKKVDDLPWEEQ